MLVLVVKRKHSLYIGKDKEIEVKILGCNAGQVRLGIAAPLETPILRADAKVKVPRAPELKNNNILIQKG